MSAAFCAADFLLRKADFPMKHANAVVLTVYLIIRIIVAAALVSAILDGRLYTAFQCLLSLVLFLLPSILNRRFSIELPNTLEVLVILFIFASAFLGEVHGWYLQYPIWDSMLHTVSGFLTTAIGMSMIDLLNRSEHVKFRLSAGFVVLFSFCFSITVGVLWEFFEFAADMLFHMDMQKDAYVQSFTSALLGGGRISVNTAALNGSPLPGWLDIGLIDTMKDLLVCAAGAVIFCVFGYFYLKFRGSGWITRLMPRRK